MPAVDGLPEGLLDGKAYDLGTRDRKMSEYRAGSANSDRGSVEILSFRRLKSLG
jgi:hypothetical protein